MSDDDELDGAQPRCPSCRVLMRDEPGADVCPACGTRAPIRAVAIPRFDGPSILGG